MHFAHFDIKLFRIRVLTKAQTADPRKRKLNLTVFTLVSWLLSLAILRLLTQGRLSRINAWLGGAVWLMELALFVPAVIFTRRDNVLTPCAVSQLIYRIEKVLPSLYNLNSFMQSYKIIRMRIIRWRIFYSFLREDQLSQTLLASSIKGAQGA